MPRTGSGRSVLPSALAVLATACALLTTGIALAGPAAAIEDPRRPGAEVTHGPSCGPGVVRVTVTNGTQPHRVALVFDGTDVQQSAELAAGATVELVSADVDWGQTVDVSVALADAAGRAEEPIEFGTYTRPTAEDCAAVSDPAAQAPGAAVPATTAPPASTGSQDDALGRPASASAASVAPGGVVTVRASGFRPGEPVSVSMRGLDGDLTTVTAATDGSVEAVVQIPRAAALGTATVELVGGRSAATAGLDLQVAARARALPAQPTAVPGLAAGTALLGTVGALGLTAARRPRGSAVPAPR